MSYPPQQPYVPQAPKKMNIFALLGFVFSIVLSGLSLFCFPFLLVVPLVFSIVGLVQIGKDPSQSGKGLAIAGIVISSLAMVVFVIFLGILATSN